jgi:hypothetical protein
MIIKINKVEAKKSQLHPVVLCTIYLFYCLFASPLYAKESTSIEGEIQCPLKKSNIIFKPHTIFDENKENIYFFHRWANWLHINTKKFTLENEAAFFLQECLHNQDDIEELERHFRAKKYLRDAKVSFNKPSNKVTVSTWDNWSLLPTASFNRKGGKNSYSWGVKERNLLGLGIYTNLESYKNTQRSGYFIKASMPLFQKQNTDLYMKLADNDDGNKKSVFVRKNFAGFKTLYGYRIGFNDELRNDTIFQNGNDQAKFSHNISYKQVSYSWLKENNSVSVLRYQLGLTQNKETFSAIKLSDESFPSSIIPHNRDFLYPWFGLSYIEKDFHKLSNIHLVSQVEDFNTGWQFDADIGVGKGNNNNDSAWLLWHANVDKGFTFNNDSLLLLKLSFEGNTYQKQQTRSLLQFKGEYFHPINKQWGLYLNNLTTLSQNQYIDKPINTGGNTGVRGFPLQYQHGEHSTQFTSEIRYYPHVNIFQLFDVAATAFFDAGNTFGDSITDNIEEGWLYSVGIGARIYSPHSSKNHQMIHIDLAFPISDNPEINSMVIRLEVKKAF